MVKKTMQADSGNPMSQTSTCALPDVRLNSEGEEHSEYLLYYGGHRRIFGQFADAARNVKLVRREPDSCPVTPETTP